MIRKPDALLPPAYLVASFLILFPVVDSLAQFFPLQLSSAQWRFGVLGLSSRALMTPMLGLLLLVGISLFAGHRGVTRTLGVLSWLVVVLCMGAAGIFGLDYLEMRSVITDEAQRPFLVSSAIALLKYGLVAAAAAWLGIAAFVVTRRSGPQARDSHPAGVVVRPDRETRA